MSFDAGSVEARLVLNRSDFTRGLAAAQSEADKGIKVPVSYDLNTSGLTASLNAQKTVLKSAGATTVPVTYAVDTAGSIAALNSQKAALKVAGATQIPVTYGVNTSALSASLLAAQKTAAVRNAMTIPVNFNVGTTALSAKLADVTAKIAQVQARMDRLNAVVARPQISPEMQKAYAELDDLTARLDVLGRKQYTAKIEADTAAATARIAELNALLDRLEARDTEVRVKASADLLAAQAALARLTLQLADVQAEADKTGAKFTVLQGILAGTTSAITGTGNGWGLLTRQITLFGGALASTGVHLLTSVAVWHVLVDWVIEFAAVLIPATLALGAFGVAAAGTVEAIANHLKAINTVATATGQSIAPLTGQFQNLQNAVKPQVYQLYGDALTIISGKSGALTKVVTATGSALDQLGARFTVAVTSGNGFGGIMASGAQDVLKLGTVIGNLGGTLGNLLKAMPGYAEIFLNLWVAFSRGLEVLTAVTIPILNVGLALHGLIIYAGLAVTGIMLLASPLKSLVIWAGTGIITMVRLGAAMIALAASGDVLGAAMLFVNATGGPVVGALAPVAALPVLVFWMASTKSATVQLPDSLDKTIQQAPTVSAAIAAMAVAHKTLAQTLTAAEVALNGSILTTTRDGSAAHQMVVATQEQTGVTEYGITGYNRYGVAIYGVTAAYQHASQAVADAKAGLQKFSAEQATSATRLNYLSKTYGSTTTALEMLNAAGITGAQWQNASASEWEQIKAAVASTALAYSDMSIQSGILGNATAVLLQQTSDQYKAMQNVNSAWDTFIGNVTKSQGSFDTFALGMVTLRQNFTKANEAASSTTHTLGGIKVASSLAGAAMDGLSQASLTLNQAFGTQVTNATAMIDTWRTAGIANNLFTRGVKDTIAPLTHYARGSTQATAQLVALAEEAGYNGPASMKALVKWLGNTSNPTPHR